MSTLPMTFAAPPATTSERLPMRQKVGYGLGSILDMWGHWLYSSLAYQVFNIALGVAPGLISTVMMLKVLMDAVSDACFGWLSDNTRTRWGRRRPFILVGGVLAGVGLPLLFAVGRGWSNMEYFAFMLVSLLVYVPVMSCFNMPWVSLGAEMTPDYHERTSVMQVKNAIQKLPELGMFIAAQFTTLAIFNDTSGKPDILRGAQAYTTILGAIMVAASVAMFFMVRERYYAKVVVTQTAKVPFRDTLYRTLRNKPFRVLLGTMMAYAMATAMVGVLGYYITIYYVCHGDVAMGGRWNSAMGVSQMAFGLAGIFFFGAIAKRHGKRLALIAVLAGAIAAFVGDWWFYNPEFPALQLLASGFVSFTGAGFWTIYGSALADVIDHDELESGQRREGSFAACQSWISKVGLAVGNGASGWILQFTGFDAKLPVQGDNVILVMRVLLSGLPVIGLAIALVLVLRLRLDEKRMGEIRVALENRRGTV
jgi:glycoside/pentoside/hexuronide:cation symporter, GPH family